MSRDGSTTYKDFATLAEAEAATKAKSMANMLDTLRDGPYDSGYATFRSKCLSGVAPNRKAAEEACAAASAAIVAGLNDADDYMHAVSMAYLVHTERPPTDEERKRKRDAGSALGTALRALDTARAGARPLAEGALATCTRCGSSIRAGPTSVPDVRNGACPACTGADCVTFTPPDTGIQRIIYRRTLLGASDATRFTALGEALTHFRATSAPALVSDGSQRVLLLVDTLSGHF